MTERPDRSWQASLLPTLEKHTTAHYDIFYARGSPAARDIDIVAQQREAGYTEIQRFLGIDASPRITLVFFEDEDRKRAVTGHSGMGMAGGTLIVEVYNDARRLDPFHETAHILAGPLGGAPAILTEGFGIYISERLGAPPLRTLGGGEASLYQRVKTLRQEGRWIPLAELLTYREIGSDQSQPSVAYAEAGAFVKYLVGSSGREAFLTAFRELRDPENEARQRQNVATLERLTGKSLSELNRAWLTAMGIEEASAATASAAANLKPFVAPAEPLSAAYTIDVKLDPEQKRVTGTETIRLTNRSLLTLATLALTKGPGGGSSFDLTIGGGRPAVVPAPEEAVGDAPLLVVLPEPLAPGKAVDLELTFRAPITLSFYGDWRLTEWHPKLWWGYPTRDDYSVKIDAPAGWNLAASGRLDDGGVWRAQGARSFGIVTERDYQMSEADAGGVHLRALYKPAGKRCAELVLRTAAEVIPYYQQQWGFYPQPLLSLVPGGDGPWGGYPVATGIVTIHGEEAFEKASLDHWRWITAHELGHQYFGEHVFSEDQFDHWLMIALGIYLDRGFSRTHGVSPGEHRQFADRYLRGIAEGNDTTAELPEEQLARVDFDRNNVVIHGKGYAIVSALETVVGPEAFGRAVQACLQQFAGKRMTAVDLQRACEAQSGQDLGWFFSQWTRSNRQLAYRIAAKESTQQGGRYRTRVTVERTGSLAMPVPVEARFEDGSTQRVSTDQSSARWQVTFDSTSPLKDAVLDPEGALPLREAPLTTADDEIADLGWSGNGEKARAIFARVRTSGLTNPEGWVKLGLNLYDGHFYPEALEAMQRYCADKGSAWRYVGLIWQGHLLDLTGRRPEALECYRQAKDIIGTNSMQHSQWGMVLDAKWVEERLKTPFVRK